MVGFKLFGVQIDAPSHTASDHNHEVSESNKIRKSSTHEEEEEHSSATAGNAENSSACSSFVSESDDGYARLHRPSRVIRQRKKGTPWTEEEHRQFLMGLEKLGKGNWKGIARNYVPSRNSIQVASHAQKYFIRAAATHSNNNTRRRPSVFDVPLSTSSQDDDDDQPSSSEAVPTSSNSNKPAESSLQLAIKPITVETSQKPILPPKEAAVIPYLRNVAYVPRVVSSNSFPQGSFLQAQRGGVFMPSTTTTTVPLLIPLLVKFPAPSPHSSTTHFYTNRNYNYYSSR